MSVKVIGKASSKILCFQGIISEENWREDFRSSADLPYEPSPLLVQITSINMKYLFCFRKVGYNNLFFYFLIKLFFCQ